MKMTKKKVFVAALAICLIAIISMGTLAWFNATDDITNNFKVATDENDTDPTFSVKVSETDLDGNETEDGVTYYNVVPGDVINKDPKITNTGDYTQWIRVSVTMTKADYWKNFGGSLKFTDIFKARTCANASSTTARYFPPCSRTCGRRRASPSACAKLPPSWTAPRTISRKPMPWGTNTATQISCSISRAKSGKTSLPGANCGRKWPKGWPSTSRFSC